MWGIEVFATSVAQALALLAAMPASGHCSAAQPDHCRPQHNHTTAGRSTTTPLQGAAQHSAAPHGLPQWVTAESSPGHEASSKHSRLPACLQEMMVDLEQMPSCAHLCDILWESSQRCSQLQGSASPRSHLACPCPGLACPTKAGTSSATPPSSQGDGLQTCCWRRTSQQLAAKCTTGDSARTRRAVPKETQPKGQLTGQLLTPIRRGCDSTSLIQTLIDKDAHSLSSSSETCTSCS